MCTNNQSIELTHIAQLRETRSLDTVMCGHVLAVRAVQTIPCPIIAQTPTINDLPGALSDIATSHTSYIHNPSYDHRFLHHTSDVAVIPYASG